MATDEARQGTAGHGEARQGEADMARPGMARLGTARQGEAGQAGRGRARPGEARRGRTKTVPLADLVFDFQVYPRHTVDRSHSAEIARAMEAGLFDDTDMPVVDAKSLRVVDGFHRVTAWRKHLGTGGSIKVELRDYPDEKALIEDAVRLNSSHGRKLDSQDKARAALLLERAGVTVREISVVLKTTETRVRELTNVRIVRVETSKGPERRAAKPVAWPKPDGEPRTFSEEQYETMRSSSGHRTAQTVTQLTRELEGGVVDVTDEKVVDKLWRLHDVIATVLPERVA